MQPRGNLSRIFGRAKLIPSFAIFRNFDSNTLRSSRSLCTFYRRWKIDVGLGNRRFRFSIDWNASIPNESRVELEIRLAIREGGERKSKSRGIELIYIVETWLTNAFHPLSSYSDNIIQ